MPCSLQSYTIRIGTFYSRPTAEPCVKRGQNSPISQLTYLLIFTLIVYCGVLVNIYSSQLISLKCAAFLSSPYLVPPSTCSLECVECHTWDPGITSQVFQSSTLLSQGGNTAELLGATGKTGASLFSWLNSIQRNKLNHIINGNRGNRGKGINCLYWNKGPAFLANKHIDIQTIIETHKPHILGLGEVKF